METVVGAEEVDEGKFEDGRVGNTPSSNSSTKQISDPVVYKLVRVEGDGRLVPATDDEIMEVVDLLKDDSSEMHIVAESGQAIGVSIEESSSVKSQSELSGFLKFEDVEADAENLDTQIQETPCAVPPSSDDNNMNPLENAVECSKSSDPMPDSGSCGAAMSLMPDFSKLKGEICLDNLSIRELHETFRATFGRETTVKDKMWLKRRIAIGLTNTCDIPNTSFIIKDNQILKLDEEGSSKNINTTTSSEQNLVARIEQPKDSEVCVRSQMENCQISSGKRLRDSDLSDDSAIGLEVLHQEKNAKRIRKPTKRYIEELSEVECHERGGRLITSAKSSGQASPRSCARPTKTVSSDCRTYVSRMDSLARVWVPCVSRVRRSRPRKDILALTGFYRNGQEMTAKLATKAPGVRPCQPPGGIEHKNEKASSPPVKKQPSVELADSPRSVMDKIEIKQNLGLKRGDSNIIETKQSLGVKRADSIDSISISKELIATVPTAKGGIRRKHHRAWTLSEVMRLVEGVSMYGAGRWSEIKRLAFASYSYRTSVDLKDKWRNLLKASFAPAPTDKGLNSRKHVTTPIPAPILLRVRELAEMHAQTSPNISTSKIMGCSGSVNGTRSGYL